MNASATSRRSWLKGSAKTLAGLAVLQVAGPSRLFGQSVGQLIPWLDQPPPNPSPNARNLLNWETLESWLTPTNNFFSVNHFGMPGGLDEGRWRVDIAGMVGRPRSLTMADIKAQPRHEVDFTLECSGNAIIPGVFFQGGIGTAHWAGARLAPLLEQANIQDDAIEVIFWGADRGTLTLRDSVGIISPGMTGTIQPDTNDLTITEQFARSMSVQEALARDNILCYEMNGDPLPAANGFPVRLIAPGWFGIANVKWLTRIELIDRRWAGNFMGRDYVSIREQQRDGQTVWTFLTVGRDRLKSAPAKLTRAGNRYTIMGAAWGAPIGSVEVQIDSGSWMPAQLQGIPGTPRRRSRDYAWRFWTFNWDTPTLGEHTIRSRAIDIDGNVQPVANDPFLASRVTYWESNGQVTRRVRIVD